MPQTVTINNLTVDAVVKRLVPKTTDLDKDPAFLFVFDPNRVDTATILGGQPLVIPALPNLPLPNNPTQRSLERILIAAPADARGEIKLSVPGTLLIAFNSRAAVERCAVWLVETPGIGSGVNPLTWASRNATGVNRLVLGALQVYADRKDSLGYLQSANMY